MRTDQQVGDPISSDLHEMGTAAKKLVNDVIRLGSLGFGTTFLEWVASFAAMYVTDSLSLGSTACVLFLASLSSLFVCWWFFVLCLWILSCAFE